MNPFLVPFCPDCDHLNSLITDLFHFYFPHFSPWSSFSALLGLQRQGNNGKLVRLERDTTESVYSAFPGLPTWAVAEDSPQAPGRLAARALLLGGHRDIGAHTPLPPPPALRAAPARELHVSVLWFGKNKGVALKMAVVALVCVGQQYRRIIGLIPGQGHVSGLQVRSPATVRACVGGN